MTRNTHTHTHPRYTLCKFHSRNTSTLHTYTLIDTIKAGLGGMRNPSQQEAIQMVTHTCHSDTTSQQTGTAHTLTHPGTVTLKCPPLMIHSHT